VSEIIVYGLFLCSTRAISPFTPPLYQGIAHTPVGVVRHTLDPTGVLCCLILNTCSDPYGLVVTSRALSGCVATLRHCTFPLSIAICLCALIQSTKRSCWTDFPECLRFGSTAGAGEVLAVSFSHPLRAYVLFSIEIFYVFLLFSVPSTKFSPPS